MKKLLPWFEAGCYLLLTAVCLWSLDMCLMAYRPVPWYTYVCPVVGSVLGPCLAYGACQGAKKS